MRISKNKSVIESLGKEHLKNVIGSTDCISSVLRSYGLTPAGSCSRTVLKRICKEWNLELKFNQGYISERHRKYAKKRALEEIFCENSKVSQTVLRRAIQRDNLLDLTKCSICGIINVWNNKPITFIFDHINGINTDNRLENIRIVCPNCNSQLETTGSKNNHRQLV